MTTIPGPDLQVRLAKGERLYFHVNQNVSTSYDTTSWVPVRSYDGLDKVTCDSAVERTEGGGIVAQPVAECHE